MEFPFSKLQACKLQSSSLHVFKTLQRTSPVDSLSTKTGADRLSTDKVLYTAAKIPRKSDVLLASFVDAG